jgi:hypothetical protein
MQVANRCSNWPEWVRSSVTVTRCADPAKLARQVGESRTRAVSCWRRAATSGEASLTPATANAGSRYLHKLRVTPHQRTQRCKLH